MWQVHKESVMNQWNSNLNSFQTHMAKYEFDFWDYQSCQTDCFMFIYAVMQYKSSQTSEYFGPIFNLDFYWF